MNAKNTFRPPLPRRALHPTPWSAIDIGEMYDADDEQVDFGDYATLADVEQAMNDRSALMSALGAVYMSTGWSALDAETRSTVCAALAKAGAA
jgi:hypothetical protein